MNTYQSTLACHSERSEESGNMAARKRRAGFFGALRMTEKNAFSSPRFVACAVGNS
jgi:hypothetical protein